MESAEIAKKPGSEQSWDGVWLAQLREAADYTQTELAEALEGVTRRVSRRLKKIEQLPKRDQEALLRTIDAFLGTTA